MYSAKHVFKMFYLDRSTLKCFKNFLYIWQSQSETEEITKEIIVQTFVGFMKLMTLLTMSIFKISRNKICTEAPSALIKNKLNGTNNIVENMEEIIKIKTFV